MNKKGSATLVVIMFAIAFILYATSTFADVRHMKNQYSEYERLIIEKYETEYNQKTQEL